MNKLRIIFLVAVVTAIGLLICPQSPHVDGSYLLRHVLKAQKETSYCAVQKKMCVMYCKEIRTMSKQQNNHQWDPENEKLIFENYTPLVEGKDKIAGRSAWVLRLKPKTKQMPWKQLWIDQKSFVVLASRDWTAYNYLKRSMKTVAITIDPHKRAGISKIRNGLPNTRSFSQPKYLPCGFKLIKTNSERLVYSDGLYTMSVCHNLHCDVKCPKNRAFNWGQGLIYSITRNEKPVFIIGDLTDKEIARVANSIPQ